MDKLKIGWGIRAMRCEERILKNRKESVLRKCWKEKEENG